MTFNTQDLLRRISDMTKSHLAFAEKLKKAEPAILFQKPDPGKWNALQCLEHLNRYGNFYLPEINKRISNAKEDATPEFKSGWLGNYLAESMLPKEKLNKMKAFKSMNPIDDVVNTDVIDTFISQQKQLLKLLENAAQVNLSKVKTSISITRFVKLRLGDTLRFLIYHNQRHIEQAERALLQK